MASVKKSTLSRAITSSPVKKSNDTRFTFFSHKKLWIGIGIVVTLLIAITGRSMFLGTNSFLPDLLTHYNDATGSNVPVIDGVSGDGQVQPKLPIGTKTGTGAGHDLQVGPVRLDNSSYITDKLDQFVIQQNQDQSSPSESSTTSSSPAVLWQDALTNPIKFLEGYGYGVKISFLNSSRKTTLLKLIDSISRYYISFGKFPDLDPGQDYGDYPWIKEMVDTNEMSGLYQYLIKTTDPVAYCGTVQQTGYCYSTNGQDAIIYVRLEKPFESDVCGMEGGLLLLWSSAENKFGNVCMSEEPNGYAGFDYFILR